MEQGNPFILVFVCTGNICRSPLAEGIMKEILIDYAEETGVSPPIKVLSAGIQAMPGYPASEHSVEAAAEDGINIRSHQSQQFDGEIASAADLILTMEYSHVRIIRNHWPEVSHIETLKRFGRDGGDSYADTDVMDPIGMGLGVYRSVYREIRAELERVAPLIFRLAEEKSDRFS